MNEQDGENGRDSARPPSPNTDVIQNIMGHFGRYHFYLFVTVCLCKYPIALHQMAIIFLAPKVKYGCPVEETCPCLEPKYDTTLFTNTIITEWNLICGRKWMASFNQTLFQLGTLVGSMLFGSLSDRFGRKKPILIAVVIQVVAGLTASAMPTYETFTLFRFLIGMSVGGTMVISFVILMEFSSAKHREVISALYQVPFNLGNMFLPIFSYFLRDYSSFHIGISIPAVLCVTYFWFIWETPRWLLAMQKTDKAINILERVAKINGLPVDNIPAIIESYQNQLTEHHLKKGTVLDLFRTPNIRKNILAMAYNWFTCSYCYYGITQYVGQLSGNVFWNVAGGACVTLGGTLLSIPLMKVAGRKHIVMGANFVCAICLLILAVIPEGLGSVVCACIGEVTSFVVFVVVYLYCSELFPTVVRNAAIGFSSMMARVGSMIAPFVIDLRAEALWLPPLIFAIIPLFAGFVTMLMPETKGCVLMTTIEEGEEFGKKK